MATTSFSTTTIITTEWSIPGNPVHTSTLIYANGIPLSTSSTSSTSTPSSTTSASSTVSSLISQNTGATEVQTTTRNSEKTSSASFTGTASGNPSGYGIGRNTTTSASTQATEAAGSSSTSSTGISAGAVAGIAIGCVVVGLIAGLFAACILLRRKSRRNEAADAVVVHHELEAYDGQTFPVTEKAHASDIQLNQFLLEATPDRDVAREVQSLGALIHQHVENYYHSRPVNANTHGLSTALEHLGFSNTNSSLEPRSLAALCLDPKTRQAALRHVIMRTAFKSIDFDFHSRNGRLLSMLPLPVASFLQAMPPVDDNRNSDPRATSLALREWRSLSAFLLHPNRNLRTPLPIDEAAVTLQAQGLVESLSMFLQVFVEADPGAVQQQGSHLQAVILECAKLGYVLLSHPSDWALVTDAASTKQGVHGVVVEAGLSKLSDRDGPPYSCAQSVVEPVVVYCTTSNVDNS